MDQRDFYFIRAFVLKVNVDLENRVNCFIDLGDVSGTICNIKLFNSAFQKLFRIEVYYFCLCLIVIIMCKIYHFFFIKISEYKTGMDQGVLYKAYTFILKKSALKYIHVHDCEDIVF